LASGLECFFDAAVRQNTGRQKRPAKAAAAINCSGEFADLEPRSIPIKATHDAPVAIIRLRHPSETAAIPPEAVTLGFQRPAGIHARVDEKQRAIVTYGRSTNSSHKIVVTGRGLNAVAQRLRPTCN